MLGCYVSSLLVDTVDTGDNLLVGHETGDAQHGNVAVAEIDGTLWEHGLLVEVVPDKVDVAIAEVFHELVAGSFDIAPRVEIEGW